MGVERLQSVHEAAVALGVAKKALEPSLEEMHTWFRLYGGAWRTAEPELWFRDFEDKVRRHVVPKKLLLELQARILREGRGLAEIAGPAREVSRNLVSSWPGRGVFVLLEGVDVETASRFEDRGMPLEELRLWMRVSAGQRAVHGSLGDHLGQFLAVRR